MKQISKNISETQEIAKTFINSLLPRPRATVVGLYGELGAGKTTFTQALAKSLGVMEPIVSPTFVIEKIYELSGQKYEHLVHIDAYRLESARELEKLGWNDLVNDPHNLIIIEWPEKVAEIMPDHIKVHLSHGEDASSRIVEID